MMKKYEKPQIVFEDFSLSNNIAANCEVKTPLQSLEAGCGFPVRGGSVFLSGTLCTHVTQDETYNGFCYHNPSDVYNLFNS